MSYDVEMAKLFKERDNIDIDEAIIGKVISTTPLLISIYNGQINLNSNQCYICESLKNIYGTITLDHIPEHGSITTKFAITRNLNPGDKVICVPTANGNKYFIVDKVVV